MMPGLATFRVVMALAWLVVPLWFESTKVTPNNNARKEFIATRRTHEKDIPETIVRSLTESTDNDGGAAAPSDGIRRRSQNRNKSRIATATENRQMAFPYSKERKREKGNGESKKPRVKSNIEFTAHSESDNPSPHGIADRSGKERSSKSGHQRVAERSSHSQRNPRQGKRAKQKTESAQKPATPSTKPWEDNRFLKLGLNPKIEVGIDILHDHEWTTEQQDAKETAATVPGSGTEVVTTSPPTENKTGGDMCQRWLNCPGDRQLVKLARFGELPSCPCTYSFDIHYKDEVWDRGRRRLFRWRDASGPPDQMDTFRPGAHWCIRSLVSDSAGGSGMATQQCCYDRQRKLLTRGAGAGTPNVVSPEVSRDLHHKVDVVPWMACRGDWTRYHLRRKPNNGLLCPENPGDRIYSKEIQSAKNY